MLTLEGQVRNLEALVGTLGSGDDRGVADQRVVDTRIWYQVGLELVEIGIESAVEAERRCDRRDNLGDQSVEVLIAGPRDIQVPPADIVHSFIVNQESAVRVLDRAVGRKNSIVRLNHGGGDTWSRVDCELELAFLAVVCRQPLKEERAKAGAGAATEGVEDEETLEGVAII